MAKYKHLFFDLDHTLWDFATNAKEALTDIYILFEMEKKNIFPFDDFYKKYLHHNELLWDRYHKGFISAEELKWKRMWRTLLEFKIGEEQLAKDISAKFLELLPVKAKLFAHCKEILEYLTVKKYVLHLITNGFEQTQWNKLNSSNLGKYFTQVITSEGSNSLKPQKEIFEYALNKAGASVNESIMIGDNLDADIKGAMNAGMDTVFVNHINASTELKPTYTIYHLQELESIF
ncbi:MAG: YjjG family noncanonical pyrimidine nucleotidase [Thermoproteota archaeon]|nr:YjjG family noncanonical pyrimidine nucleotidase [Thermoproteota archaeon]